MEKNSTERVMKTILKIVFWVVVIAFVFPFVLVVALALNTGKKR